MLRQLLTGIFRKKGFRAFRLLTLCGLLILPGCYMPSDFVLNMRFEPDGRYAFDYEGDLIQLAFLQRIGKGELKTRDEIARYTDIYARDLERDKGFKKVVSNGTARYAVTYHHEGNIIKERSFNFVRRNGWFMRIGHYPDGTVRIEGNVLPSDYRNELIAKGFDGRGVIRIWTKAKVVSSNATGKTEGELPSYEWQISTLRDPAPQLTLQLGK